MVGNGVVGPVNTQIEHECRAGKPLGGDGSIAPAPPEPIGHQPGHAAGKIGVDDGGVGFVAALSRADSRHLFAGKFQRFDRLVIENLNAHLLSQTGHHRRYRAAAANRMVDAMFVLKERKDREQARAAEGRHPQIFRLKREGQPNAFIGEKRAQFRIEALPGLQQRHQLEQIGVDQIPPALKGLLEEGGEAVELLPGGLHEPGERAPVPRGDPRNLCLHPPDVGGGQEFVPCAEDKPVLGIESHHLDFPPQVVAAGGEDLVEHPRVEKERRPQIEPKSLGGGDGAGAAPGEGQPLKHPHADSSGRQKHSAGQTPRTCTDDIDRVGHQHSCVD